MIYVISISLQVAGALLLMINALSTRRDKVIRRFLGKGLVSRDNNTNTIVYDKERLKETYKEAYLSKFAFMFIALGYFFGIFSNIEDDLKLILALIIIAMTVVIMILSYVTVNLVVKYKKSVNCEITNEELNELGIEPDIENTSNEEIAKWFD